MIFSLDVDNFLLYKERKTGCYSELFLNWHSQWFWFCKGNPFIRIPLDTGEHTEIYVFVCVSGTSFLCSTTKIITVTKPLAFEVRHPVASPFYTVWTPFLFGDTKMFHCKGAVIRVGRVTVLIITDLFERTFISGVIRNENSGEMKVIQQHPIGFDGIEGGIS